MVFESSGIGRQRMAIVGATILLAGLLGAYFTFNINTRETLVSYVAEMNGKVPLQIDSNTKIESVDLDQSDTVHFYYLINETKEVDLKAIQEAIKLDAAMFSCSEPTIQSLLRVASKISFHYKGKDGTQFYTFDLNQDKCKTLLSSGTKKILISQ